MIQLDHDVSAMLFVSYFLSDESELQTMSPYMMYRTGMCNL